MDRTHDIIGRRLRYLNSTSDKRVRRTPRDLQWIELIHRLGPQTSAALIQATPEFRDANSALHRMTDLRRSTNSEWGGPLLSYPPQQRRGATLPDNNYNVYSLTPIAIQALKKAGRFRPDAPTTNNREWKHDFFGSTVSASFYIAASRARHTFLFHDEIVAKCGRSFAVSGYRYKDRNDTWQTRHGITLRPDGFFGIRYRNGQEIIFCREEDCGTEVNESENFERKSHGHTIRTYHQFIGRGEYKRVFGPARVIVLNTFSNRQKMTNVMNVLLKLSGGKGSSFMLYNFWTAFDDYFRPPAPRTDLFGIWDRVGHEPFDISEAAA